MEACVSPEKFIGRTVAEDVDNDRNAAPTRRGTAKNAALSFIDRNSNKLLLVAAVFALIGIVRIADHINKQNKVASKEFSLGKKTNGKSAKSQSNSLRGSKSSKSNKPSNVADLAYDRWQKHQDKLNSDEKATLVDVGAIDSTDIDSTTQHKPDADLIQAGLADEFVEAGLIDEEIMEMPVTTEEATTTVDGLDEASDAAAEPSSVTVDVEGTPSDEASAFGEPSSTEEAEVEAPLDHADAVIEANVDTEPSNGAVYDGKTDADEVAAPLEDGEGSASDIDNGNNENPDRSDHSFDWNSFANELQDTTTSGGNEDMNGSSNGNDASFESGSNNDSEDGGGGEEAESTGQEMETTEDATEEDIRFSNEEETQGGDTRTNYVNLGSKTIDSDPFRARAGFLSMFAVGIVAFFAVGLWTNFRKKESAKNNNDTSDALEDDVSSIWSENEGGGIGGGNIGGGGLSAIAAMGANSRVAIQLSQMNAEASFT